MMPPNTRRATLGLLAAAAGLPAGTAFAQAADPIELPDEDAPNAKLDTTESRNQHMLAPVSINGQGPFNFLLDTGANASCVANRLVAELSLAPGPGAMVHTVAGVRKRPTVVIDHLEVGGRNRRRVHAPALPLSAPEYDGVLGVDWLKGQRLVLNFRDRRMEITRSRPDTAEPGRVVVVPARRRHGQLTIVDAEMGGRPISAIIDSGAESTLCNGPLRELVREIEKRRKQPQEPQYVTLESIAGETFRGETLFVPFMRLGGLHLGNVQVTYTDAHVFNVWGLKDRPALVIGIDLLKQFEEVALDFGRSAVRFEFV